LKSAHGKSLSQAKNGEPAIDKSSFMTISRTKGFPAPFFGRAEKPQPKLAISPLKTAEMLRVFQHPSSEGPLRQWWLDSS
jgi:hypothetical protein